MAPAVVKTKFAAALYAEGEDKVSAAYPMKRLGEPGGRGRAGRVPGVGRGVVDHRRDRAGRRRAARHRHPRLSRDNDFHPARPARGVVEHRATWLGHVEYAWLGSRQQRGEPRIRTQGCQRRGVAAEHDGVQPIRLGKQHPSGDVRGGLQCHPRLALAAAGEPARGRSARPVPAVYQSRAGAGAHHPAVHRHPDAVTTEPDEEQADPPAPADVVEQRLDHQARPLGGRISQPTERRDKFGAHAVGGTDRQRRRRPPGVDHARVSRGEPVEPAGQPLRVDLDRPATTRDRPRSRNRWGHRRECRTRCVQDVLVVGGGPAGRAVAAACGARGLRTTLVDLAPERPWTATYGAWAAELPTELPCSVIAAQAAGRVIATGEHRLGWDYAVLDVPALRAHLDAGLSAGAVTVALARAGRERLPAAAVVIDAGGHRQPLTGRRRATRVRAPAEQTAVGVVVDQDTAAALVHPDQALFMDWRPDHGEPGWPTFLYAIPLGGGAVLLEETSLARRPGLPLPVLRRRLHARLARHGIDADSVAAAPEERVRFPVDTPRHRVSGVLGFGAAAPLVHPATGYSLAAALRLAPAVAAAISTGLGGGGNPQRALAAARAEVWPPAARAVHALRRRGLEALLGMPPAVVPVFFDGFFSMEPAHRWAYLTARENLVSTAGAMAALFRAVGSPLCWRLVRAGLPTHVRALEAEPG